MMYNTNVIISGLYSVLHQEQKLNKFDITSLKTKIILNNLILRTNTSSCKGHFEGTLLSFGSVSHLPILLLMFASVASAGVTKRH